VEINQWAVVAVILIIALNHNAKKWFAKQKTAKDLSDAARLARLEAFVKDIPTVEQWKKVENETKVLASALSVKSLGR